jgi:hypothetical protein
MRKVSDVLLAAGAAALLFALPVWAAADPAQLVKSVTAHVIDIVKTKTGATREAAFREVLRNDFDLPYMGRLALGTRKTSQRTAAGAFLAAPKPRKCAPTASSSASLPDTSDHRRVVRSPAARVDRRFQPGHPGRSRSSGSARCLGTARRPDRRRQRS